MSIETLCNVYIHVKVSVLPEANRIHDSVNDLQVLRPATTPIEGKVLV